MALLSCDADDAIDATRFTFDELWMSPGITPTDIDEDVGGAQLI